MFCLEEAIHNEFRYNVSVDDLGGLISPSGNPDAWIHHNVFYRRAEVPFVRPHMDDGKYVAEENEIHLIKKKFEINSRSRKVTGVYKQ